MRRPRSPIFLPLAMAAVLAAACRQHGETAPANLPRPTRGYILISIDTLRADHLGIYGHQRDTSPFLDSLARRGTLFENAVVQYPSTLTSHMSILTGLYPGEHGVYPPDGVLSPEIPTLAELFRDHGFQTGGFTEGGFMHGRFGFRRGFASFKSRDRRGQGSTELTFRRGVDFLESLAADQRFFLFLHTYSVHAPYDPPQQYRDLFGITEPAGAFEPTGSALSHHNATGDQLADDLLAYFELLYDASIRHLDDVLRSFFADLERLGISDDVTVVITSDHGEELQDHGRMNHTQLYREVLHVPLIVVHPDGGAGRRSSVVESLDIAPTLLDLARINDRPPLSGRSLAPEMDAKDAADDDRDGYAEVSDGQWSLLRRTRRGLFHLLIFDPPELLWHSRRALLDTAESRLELEARTFGEPRPLEIRLGDDVLRTVELTARWTRIDLDLAGAGKKRLLFSVPSCTPFEGSDPERGPWRCRGFQLRGLPLGRVELYDLVTDPEELRDLSAEKEDVTRVLVDRLRGLRHEARAAAATEELDPELEAHLRALGYLQ